ncbi:hypothetical protein GH714_001710 [Hevea brasiliensis]|uniref:tyrosine--tRNA ligase n=1 Tax=Hevea brasiliensis TaxID=3981 RepID=A0A6A6MA27_HEVBR|nr:hypothetical protein GH714_001710 [Hevea brasiliensis]
MSTEEQIPPTQPMQYLSVNSTDSSSNSTSASASSQMTPEERFRIVRSVGEECIQEDELFNLLAKKPQPICYDGFEPSGRMHIAQGVMKTINVNKLTSAGCKVKIWIADWFAQLNNKMGGDLKKIQTVGRYLIEIWKAVGWILKGINSLVAVNVDMLPGLQQGQEKMSKSDPSSSIFMEDEEAEVNVKIKKAYCPPKIVEGNPCLQYIKYIIFPWFHEFKVERSMENGGEKTFKSFEELVAEYESGELHPGDVKPALSRALNKILQPVRDHFNKDANAKDLLKTGEEIERAQDSNRDTVKNSDWNGNPRLIVFGARIKCMEALYPASEYYHPPGGVFSKYGQFNAWYLVGGGSTVAILLTWGIYAFFKKYNLSVGCSCSISNSHVPDIESQS